MKKDQQKSVIVVKKVKKHGDGHHGGSWKVAYADFVTAMMAFFLVMWIMSLDEDTRKSIEGYFQQAPIGLSEGIAAGSRPLAAGNAPVALNSLRMVSYVAQQQQFEQIGQRIRATLQGEDGLGELETMVEIVVTAQGLRIELVENRDGETFFDVGSAVPRAPATRALQIIAAELRGSTSAIVLEGHTDAAQYGRPGYSNWELSADRANSARQLLQSAGIAPDRIREIRGYADRHLRVPTNPLDASNRRIAILLPFAGEG